MNLRRDFLLAWKSLWLHRLRSLLTVLGIMFGVAAVIAMLAIGEGTKVEAQRQIQRLGSRNLLLASVKPLQNESAADANERVLEYGITWEDLRRIRETVPDAVRAVPRRDIPGDAQYAGRKTRSLLMGTTPEYVDVANLRLVSGRWLTPADGSKLRQVCVLGSDLARRLFRSRDPVGESVRFRRHYFEVVGLLSQRGEGTGGTAGTGGESDRGLYIPIQTMDDRFGETIQDHTSGSRTRERIQLHRITVEASDDDGVRRSAIALRRILKRWHANEDVRLTVPLELMRQAEESKQLFTTMLAVIAAISLLVGGIGIMNIMLASVVERTREIGIRRALGARRVHIIRQFLAETLLLALTGGVIGVGLGIGIPLTLAQFGMTVVIRPESLVLSFAISAVVGIVFGIYPAARAADLDPVEALRHE